MLIIDTTLKQFPNKGIGLCSVHNLAKGTFVYETNSFFDILVSKKEVDSMERVPKSFIETHCSYSKDRDGYWVCVDNARFLNHSSNANLKWLDDIKKYITIRDISAGEELTCDYTTIDDYSKDGDFGFDVIDELHE